MKIRHFGIAFAALALALGGCKVTVRSGFVDLAPSSLVGYKLEFTNTVQHDPAASTLTIPPVVTYYFWDEHTVANPAFDPRTESNWSYRKHSYDTGAVEVVFAHTMLTDLVTTCSLTFVGRDNGTHRCVVEERASRTVMQETVQSGWSEGTFRLESIQ